MVWKALPWVSYLIGYPGMGETQTKKDNNSPWARSTAVSFHDKKADWFASQYAQSQRYLASSFLYGRRQIDIHLSHQIANLPKHARVLDVGCGTGEQVSRLLNYGFEVFGIEPSEKMRTYAKSKLPAGTVKDGSVLNLPFANDFFDFAYAIEVFRYLNYEDNLRGLQEIRRVLKAGGLFFGTFVNFYALDGSALLIGMRKLAERWFSKTLDFHTEFMTPRKLERMLRSVGFSDVHTHGAKIASLHIAYKLGQPIGEVCARLLEPIDPLLSDTPVLRAFAGHLIGVAQK